MTSVMEQIQILIVIWMYFIINFTFGDVIISRCTKNCFIQVEDVPDEDLFCNKECKLIQCYSGCQSYFRAVNSSCQSVCSESYKKRQYCTRGCSYGLYLYTENIKGFLGILHAPELKKDSKGYSSLTLHWNAPISSNVTYFIQSRVLDTNGDWLTYSSLQPNGDIYITGLQPYITYKFRVSVVISTNEVLYTTESENITTLPHGVPASAPTITEISAPTSSVISLSWIPPTYTNGPLLCYKLKLEPSQNKELHETNVEVPANITSWTFRQLTSSQEYLVSISAWNHAGEGQLDATNMTTPSSGNLSKEEIPYLILAEDNKVILQDMTDVVIKGPDTVHTSQTEIRGIAAHIRKQVILCSDSTGKVYQINMVDKVVTENIYPNLAHPGAMTVDWLNNHLYIVDGFMIKRCNLDRPTCIMATVMLPSQPTVIQVDPINGFLFFNQGSTNMGLYAIDIGKITPSGPANHFLLVKYKVNAFSIDFNNMQLYFPNNTLNTIMSSFLDGSSVADIREGEVVRPNYYQISSMVYSNGVFFFTNGSKVLFEEYNKEKGAFYLNEMLLFGTHYSSLNVYQQTTQPHPVPHSPPQNVRALFTDQRVFIQWNRPRTLTYQGKGAWQTWFYEIGLYQDDDTENENFVKVTGSFFQVENLVPNTTYLVKVRAWSLTGSGPWSDVFVGRTLTLVATTAKVIVAATHSESIGVLYEIDMNGRHNNYLTTLSFWERQIIDLTWTDKKIFWVSSLNKVSVYDRITSRQREVQHISVATSVAYDWLGQKLYWSNPVHNEIRRSDDSGQPQEFVIQGKARHMAIDAIQGRIYWVTMNTMEAAYLNGEDHIVYFSVPYFSGKHIISLTLNFDLRKVLWYVKSFERQELFMSDLLGNGIVEDQLSVQPLGSFICISHFSVMQYFSHRLFWQNKRGSIVVGEIECNYTSEITVDPVSVFMLTHDSLHPFPEGKNKSTLKIIPSVIPEFSIQCEGHWSTFNLTWQKAYINHGNIFYEVSIQIKDGRNIARQTTHHWIEIRDIPAYTQITVTLRAYSYWGYGPVTVSQIYSPMSVPSQPLTTRVFVTQHKESMTSEKSLAADFRWALPEHQNGIITQFIIYSWKSGDEKKKNMTSLPNTARHFNLQCLKPSMTFFFQVTACTAIGCGSRSELVSAEADALNPVPKLLVVTSDHLIIEEVDSIGNRTIILEPSVSPFTATYLAQDDRMFWTNKNNVLMETNQQVQKKLLDLNGQVSDITIDWIRRTLFIVETNTMQSSSIITSYLLDQSISFTFLSRDGQIDSVVSDPLTSTIVWTEKKIGGATYSLFKLGRDSHVTSMFSSLREKRETTRCNCTSQLQPGSKLTVDHSQDKKMEIFFYEAISNSIMGADLDGCYCRPLTYDGTNKGLPPDSLSVDHSHVYWYNKTEKLLYTLNKQSGVITNKLISDVKDIIAYGAHLQPLPSMECLKPNAYKGPVKMVQNTNQTITLELLPVVWPPSCQEISCPDTKYTVYYKSGTGTDSCGPGGSGCLLESSYNNTVTLSNLQPYTTYIVHGAVSNYYTEYLSEALSKPVLLNTLIGVPSKAVINRVSGSTPEQVDITWIQPVVPKGPIEDLVYIIQYSTQTNKGLYKATQEYNSSSSKIPNKMRISDLLPNHSYQFEVKTSNSQKKYFSISVPVTFKTYDIPMDIALLSTKRSSLTVEWTSPLDIIVFYKFQYQKCPYDSVVKWEESVPSETMTNTTYNVTFHNLQPFTDYCLRMIILYPTSYVWKGKSGFIFHTLSGSPDLPPPPKVETLSRDAGYEVVWLEPKDNGAAVNNYVLQYWNDQSQSWYDIFNGTKTRWIIDDEVIPPGKEYTFRVAAENANGLGPFSHNSTVFTLKEVAKASKDNVAIIAIALSFLFVFLLVLLMAVCYVIRRKNRKKRNPKVGRGPDTELAILRELPHTTVQQSNTLYDISIIPTDVDLAKLPHFVRDQITLKKILGSGAFGEVFEGIAKNIISDSSGETKVAVKTLRRIPSDIEKEEFLKEAVLMSNFKHDHILSLLGVCLDNDPQFIILELMEGGDLLSYLRTSRGLSPNAARLCLTDLVKICVHVARGCKYLEEMHFVHRDLAARNCLVSSKCPSEIAVKIGDFGLARDIYKNDYYRKEGEGLLPVRWMSPESLMDGVFTTQSDIWAFGVLIWEVLTFGQQPYQARTNIEVLHFVRSSGQLEQPDHCPEELYLLMSSCWSYSPEDRPTFSYILQQLELFHEKCVTCVTCVTIHNIMPVETRPVEVDGYNSYHGGPGTSNHQIYNRNQRVTSFDSPEPCDASLDSDYIHPQTNGTPTYLQLPNELVVRKPSQNSVQTSRKIDINDDIFLNYDHVPPQLHHPCLNYDYPNRQCNSTEERFEKN